ncbi:MAG: UvrD-helicase domain-containing protein, partial [Burkholderiales bacterium]
MKDTLDAHVKSDHPLRQLRFAGTSLIEASAGTGKTWTITGLYLRLLVEGDLEPRSILAVTFTNAATAELRDRIRGALARLIDHLRGERTSDDPLVLCIASTVTDDVLKTTLARLRVALDSFDEAVICTIHSFCQRALADWAFESRMPFEAELIANQRELLAEIAQDFWRRRAPRFSPSFATFVAAHEY